jgi:hypothetical protein
VKARLAASIALLALVAVTAAAAAAQPPGSPRARVVSELRAEQLRMRLDGPFRYDFFATGARAYWNAGGEVLLWQFGSRASATAAAATIARDGNTIRGHHVLWKGVPHWYRRGRVIALYVGGVSPVRIALRRVLGPQIAGS